MFNGDCFVMDVVLVICVFGWVGDECECDNEWVGCGGCNFEVGRWMMDFGCNVEELCIVFIWFDGFFWLM